MSTKTAAEPLVFIRNLGALVGRRAFRWLLLNSLIGVALGFIELGFAECLRALAILLGVSSSQTSWSLSGLLISYGIVGISTAILTVGTLRILAQVLAGQSAVVSGVLIQGRCRAFALNQMLRHPSERHVASSLISHLVNEVFPRASSFIQVFCNIIPYGVQALTVLVLLCTYSTIGTTVAILSIAVLAPIIRATGKSAKNAGKIQQPAHLALLTGIERVSRNWLLIKILRMVKYY